jgi:hypothetical protein
MYEHAHSQMSDVSKRELELVPAGSFVPAALKCRQESVQKGIAPEMTILYLHCRNAHLQQLSNKMDPVVEVLVAKKVLERDGNDLKFPSGLSRLQCAKCFYINYLVAIERRLCLRCQPADLHDSPTKKKA